MFPKGNMFFFFVFEVVIFRFSALFLFLCITGSLLIMNNKVLGGFQNFSNSSILDQMAVILGIRMNVRNVHY